MHTGSGPGERFAHRQMSDVGSPLARDGREVAQQIKKKTRRPVYYYLMKHYGVSDRLRAPPTQPFVQGRLVTGNAAAWHL